jgi:hypothetical protein
MAQLDGGVQNSSIILLAGTLARLEGGCIPGPVLIQDPGLVQSLIPVSAIQSHIVYSGEQSGYIPFEPCYLGIQPAWQTANLQAHSSLPTTITS